jgi:NRPS condensation-like uncharacterized protein
MTTAIAPPEAVSAAQKTSSEGFPLTPLERFLWSCHDKTHSMVIRAVLHFTGEVDAERLMQAYREVLQRHPLLRSRIVGTGSSARWQEDSVVSDLALVQKDDLRDSPSVDQDAAIRTRVAIGDHRTIACCDLQHTCCDGQGARQLIAEWWMIYDHLLRGKSPVLTRLDPARLAARGDIAPRRGEQRVDFWQGLRNFYVTIRGRTARLPRRDRRKSKETSDGLLVERIIERHEMAAVRGRLKSSDATINDLGLAASLLAFRKNFAQLAENHYLTVANPVDRRTISDLRLSAANRWGLAFLRRKVADCEELSSLLRSLHGEMQYVKSHHVADEFLRGLTLASRVSWGLRLVQSARLFTPTFQFTCVGESTRTTRNILSVADGSTMAGQLQLNGIAAYAPPAPNVPLSVCFLETNDRLSITVTGNAKFVDASNVNGMADRLQQIILSWSLEEPRGGDA